ncbi:MAG: RidA family protein [Burkholderiales bacterium]|nr:RidA family protein [Anaerolineae bacterium]
MSKGKVEHINPEGLHAMGYSNVIAVSGNVKTIYIGGQDSVDAKGNIVGEGDLAKQVEQTLKNVEIALKAADAKRENVIKWNIHMVAGQDVRSGYEVFQKWWGDRGNPPAVTMTFVTALARPEFLCEIDAIAIVPE